MATAVTAHSVDSPSEFVIRCAGRAAAIAGTTQLIIKWHFLNKLLGLAVGADV